MDKSKWEYKPFEDCIEKSKKTKQLMTSDYQPEGSYPIISQEASLISGYTDDADYVNHYDRPIIVFGDHTRVLKYVDFDFAVGADGVKILIPNATLNAKFLLNYLTWYKIPNLGYSRHYKLLKDISIPIPPISDQQRIVAELDCLNEMIALKQEQLKEFDKLAQSIFYDMFGDPITNEKGWIVDVLNSVCDVRDGTHDSPKYVEDGYPLITSKNVVEGGISFDDVNYISEDDLNAINARSRVDDGDIIMPMIGTIGKPVIVHKDREFAIKNVALIKFEMSKVVLNIFIQSLLNSSTYSNYILSLNRGGTQKFVSLKTIRNLPIILPPLALQQQFAEKIQAIEAQKELVKQSIAETQQLFDSRMDYYFN